MTIKDIAKISGYGIGTVSRVINNHPDVSDKTRAAILKVIDESHYEPNTNARQLKMRASSIIAVIVKGNHNMLFADTIEKIQSLLVERQEETMVLYIDEDGDEIEHALRLLRDVNPKGIIFLGANPSYFDERMSQIDVPCVISTTSGKGLKLSNISSVSTDDETAAYEMANYLVKKGHTNIAIIGGKLTEKQISYRRYMGVCRCFSENNISFDVKKQYIQSRYSMEEGYLVTKKIIEEQKDITAIFAFSDTIAIGAMRAIKDAGMAVPGDISVVGFDGILLSDYCVPRLTTIYQNIDIIARRTVDLLLKHIHYDCKADHEMAPFDLLEKESVLEL